MKIYETMEAVERAIDSHGYEPCEENANGGAKWSIASTGSRYLRVQPKTTETHVGYRSISIRLADHEEAYPPRCFDQRTFNPESVDLAELAGWLQAVKPDLIEEI